MRSNRIMKMLVSPEIFPGMLQSGKKFRVTSGGVPSDVQFRGFAHDYERNCIAVFIEHESFDLVPEGTTIPIFDPPQMENIP